MGFTNLNLLTFFIFTIIILFVLNLFYKLYIKQNEFNKEFNLLSTGKYFYVKYVFLLISLFVICFASFGVKYGEDNIKNEDKGVDMIFVLDVSKSMNVPDIIDSNYAYTRLDIIKNSISKFITTHKQDRFGLIIFAGDTVSTIPLTTDHDLFLTFLKGVDYRNLTKQGSDFNKALDLGIERFNNDDKSKVLIFISDGGEPEDKINKDILKSTIKNIKDITYFVIGVGTNKGGNIITGKDMFGRYIFQQYKGEYVISKINRINLKDIVGILNADYIEVKNIGDLSKLNKKINTLEKKVIEKYIKGELGDFGRFVTIISFICFLIFVLVYILEEKFIFIKNNNE